MQDQETEHQADQLHTQTLIMNDQMETKQQPSQAPQLLVPSNFFHLQDDSEDAEDQVLFDSNKNNKSDAATKSAVEHGQYQKPTPSLSHSFSSSSSTSPRREKQVTSQKIIQTQAKQNASDNYNQPQPENVHSIFRLDEGEGFRRHIQIAIATLRKRKTIEIIGMGEESMRAAVMADIIKARIGMLHQHRHLRVPLTGLSIKLSRNPLNSKAPGYQKPQPAEPTLRDLGFEDHSRYLNKSTMHFRDRQQLDQRTTNPENFPRFQAPLNSNFTHEKPSQFDENFKRTGEKREFMNKDSRQVKQSVFVQNNRRPEFFDAVHNQHDRDHKPPMNSGIPRERDMREQLNGRPKPQFAPHSIRTDHRESQPQFKKFEGVKNQWNPQHHQTHRFQPQLQLY
eukprot:403376167